MFFLYKGFKFQPDVCNGCHGVLIMSMNFSDIAILNIYDGDCCCIISGISKSEAINLMQNVDLTGKSGTLQKKNNFFFIYRNVQRNFNVWWYWN